jgi:Zn-dependent peptidase ImmA (M78 family)
MHERPTLVTAFYMQEVDLGHAQQEDPERQANSFAAEFLMPANELAGKHWTAAQVSAMYKVSLQAAIRHVRELTAEGLIRR